jgi:15-cis-phytoene synthase
LFIAVEMFVNMPSNKLGLLIIAAALLPSTLFCLTFFPISKRSASIQTALKTISTPSTEAIAPVGKILEGGHVIDFSYVKADNRAEEALLEARKRLEKQQRDELEHLSTQSKILGINQQVVDEVGHELGAFASETEIRDCAAYLVSKAPPGLLKVVDHETTTKFNEADILKFEAILEKAYQESGEVTSAFAKTFYLGTLFLNEKARKAIWGVYVWCRRTDEIVDAPNVHKDDMLTDLSAWEMRLERLWEFGEVKDVYDLCLLDVRVSYPLAEIQPYLDMIRGMLMDVPGTYIFAGATRMRSVPQSFCLLLIQSNVDFHYLKALDGIDMRHLMICTYIATESQVL